MGLLPCRCFSIALINTTVLHDPRVVEFPDTEELHVQRVDYKLYWNFLLSGGSVPLTLPCLRVNYHLGRFGDLFRNSRSSYPNCLRSGERGREFAPGRSAGKLAEPDPDSHLPPPKPRFNDVLSPNSADLGDDHSYPWCSL